jgi:hypothetical protein
MSEQKPSESAAGVQNGRSPSGATSAGTSAADEAPTGGSGNAETQVPGQPPGSAMSPVPSPGDVPGASVPAVAAGEGPSPEDGIHGGEKTEGSDASVASPGSYVALSPPGHPDGEVDTRMR